MIYLQTIFIISALFLGTISAMHMVDNFGAKAILRKKLEKNPEMKPEEISRAKREVVHDYFLNFLGTFLGWLSAYYFVFYRLGNTIELTDLVIIFISFVGITGYLPHIIINKGFKPS